MAKGADSDVNTEGMIVAETLKASFEGLAEKNTVFKTVSGSFHARTLV